MLVARVPKPRYLELDQLSIACDPGLLGVRVSTLRDLEVEEKRRKEHRRDEKRIERKTKDGRSRHEK